MAHYPLYKSPDMKCLNAKEAAASVESYLFPGMSWVLWKFFCCV